MLLEAYFIQIDNTHNKLQTLHEYIDDTEARQAKLCPRASSQRSAMSRCRALPSDRRAAICFFPADARGLSKLEIVELTALQASHSCCSCTAFMSGSARLSCRSAQHVCMLGTQDYINIELDSHRNQLIQLELLLTAAMFAMALVTVVAGLFGMNLYNKAENSYVAFILVRPHLKLLC